MPNPKDEQVTYPFTSFNFAVEINVEGVAERVCDASFAECDGLEMTMDVKTIREGGNNGKQIRLTGPLTFGQVTMKRGMTANLELWDWFNLMLTDQSLRANRRQDRARAIPLVSLFAGQAEVACVERKRRRCRDRGIPTGLREVDFEETGTVKA
jgi:phage tail-like protein